ncbi:AsmA family protein [Nitrosovibrio tenuis]|uniref:AsmA family protein n=1 Tax=Nitrosovibrio tenuis TaxID=1233 RepID=UPI000B877BE6|nr:AsmA family protein [Nitrosovibrio tenuis]
MRFISRKLRILRTRSARSRAVLSVLSVLLILVVAFAIWFDWNMIKPYVERQVTEKTGREFVIGGDLDVKLSLNPLVSAEGLSLANADWGTQQPMLGVDRLQFRISLLDLLAGHVVLPEVSVSQPKILLEKSADGKRNWDLKKEEKEAELPKIGKLTLDRGIVFFRDPKTKTDITAKISTDGAADAREASINVSAEGKYAGLSFAAQGQGGGVLTLTDETLPYPIKAKVEIGTTRAALDGTITGLAKLAEMDLQLDMSGEDLSALYPIVGIVIFPSPPYQISGRVLHQKSEWSMEGFSGHVGESDLGGSILFDTGGKRPMLRGDVVSKVLDLNDLKGFIGARRAPQPQDTPAEKQEKKASIEAQRDRLLPDQKFSVERLRAMDADVKFTGASIRNKDLPVEHLVSHLKIDDGLMTLDPANFAVAGGNIVSNLTINARKDVPAAEARIDVKRLQLPKLFPKVELTHGAAGVIGGSTRLKGHGESVGALLASADGKFGLVMSGGEISEMLLAALDLDAAKLIKLLFTGDKNVPVRCAVIDYDVKEGIMDSKAFVIDTEKTIVLGEGHINLAEETIKMKLSPQPKEWGFPSLRTPVHIAGTLKKPTVYPDKMLAIRIGAAVALGVLATPAAALIPLIELGTGEDANCRALIASVKQPQPAQPSRTQTKKKSNN